MPNWGVESRPNDRHGRLRESRKQNRNARHRIQSQIKGLVLFNTLTRDVQNLTEFFVDEFKCKLDEFFSKI